MNHHQNESLDPTHLLLRSNYTVLIQWKNSCYKYLPHRPYIQHSESKMRGFILSSTYFTV